MIKSLKLATTSINIVIAMLIFFTTPIKAHIFSQINSVRYNSKTDGIIYSYTISVWTPEADNTPNPCYGSHCALFISHRHFADGTSGKRDKNFNYIDISNAKTIGDVRRLWVSEYPLPLSGETWHDGAETEIDECVGFFYGDPKYQDGARNPLFPGSVCGIAPPPSGHCQFFGNALINYGNISLNELSGKELSTTISVSCDKDMKLEAWLLNPKDGSDTISLRDDESLKAKLTLDDQNASDEGKVFSVSAGQNEPLTITSQVIVNGIPQAGEFSGSAIVELSIP